MELDRHRLLLRGQLEVVRDGASAEPDLHKSRFSLSELSSQNIFTYTCVLGEAANEEVILLLAVGGVLDVELVKGHLQLALRRLPGESSIFVLFTHLSLPLYSTCSLGCANTCLGISETLSSRSWSPTGSA